MDSTKLFADLIHTVVTLHSCSNGLTRNNIYTLVNAQSEIDKQRVDVSLIELIQNQKIRPVIVDGVLLYFPVLAEE